MSAPGLSPPPPPSSPRPAAAPAWLAFLAGMATVAAAATIVWFLVRDDGGATTAGSTTAPAGTDSSWEPTTTLPPTTTAAAGTTTTDATMAGSSVCTNTVFGFTLTIPPGWEASDGDTPGEQCRFVQVPGSGGPTVIVQVETGFTFAEMKAGFAVTSADEDLVVLEEFTTAGGHPAVRAEQALVSGAIAGARRYHIVIDRPAPLWFFVQTEVTTDAATFQSLVAVMHALADTVAFS